MNIPKELYTDPQKALEWLRAIEDVVYPEVYHLHFYWRVPREFTKMQVLPIMSALVSQPSNCRVHVWSNRDLSNNEHYQLIHPYVYLHKYSPARLAMGSPIENMENILTATDVACWIDGDVFRNLVLYTVGGVYVDMDCVLLRDLSPLLQSEFVCQWGTELDKYSGAVMHLRSKSEYATELLECMVQYPPAADSTTYGCDLYDKPKSFKNLTVYPSSLYCPEWQRYIDLTDGNEGDPFKVTPHSKEMYPGSFAWHWFNRYDHKAAPGSKWDLMERTVRDRFDRLVADDTLKRIR
jgi:hypothetical protein